MAFTFEIEAETCEQVRKAIDVRLEPAMLEDSVISLGIFAGEAEERVKTLVAAWDESDVDANLDALNRAAIYFTASALAMRLPYVLEENLENDRLKFQNKDLDALSEKLQQDGLQIVARIEDGLSLSESDIDTRAGFVFRTVGACPK